MSTKKKQDTSILKTYEYWKVKPEYDNGNLTGWRKIEELITTTTMEPRFAEALNAQTHNSGFRYFEVE